MMFSLADVLEIITQNTQDKLGVNTPLPADGHTKGLLERTQR